MKQFLAALRAARKLELCVVALLLGLVLLACLNTGAMVGGEVSGEERRMQRILSAIDGAGRVRVMLSRDNDGACTGAVIAASGADDLLVQLKIQSAVQTLTGLPPDKINIVRSG